MTLAHFPQQIFQTQRTFNDYHADDMKHGDISEEKLKREYKLSVVSNVVDPYTLTRLTPFNNPQSRFAGAYHGRKQQTVSVQECAALLFNEMQVTSLPYSFYGPHKNLINQMITHFQQSTGSPFFHSQLNNAYYHKIMNDNSVKSSRLEIIKTINNLIDYEGKGLPQHRISELTKAIGKKVLPKFNSLIMDKINGLAISTHDIHATKIYMQSLQVKGTQWQAKIKYIGQDHFGLDTLDIKKMKFHQFHFFRIWFLLQRFHRFGFKPFFTNMEATIDIRGGKQ